MRLRALLYWVTSPRIQLSITTLLLAQIVITLLVRWATGANWALAAFVGITIPTFVVVYLATGGSRRQPVPSGRMRRLHSITVRPRDEQASKRPPLFASREPPALRTAPPYSSSSVSPSSPPPSSSPLPKSEGWRFASSRWRSHRSISLMLSAGVGSSLRPTS